MKALQIMAGVLCLATFGWKFITTDSVTWTIWSAVVVVLVGAGTLNVFRDFCRESTKGDL